MTYCQTIQTNNINSPETLSQIRKTIPEAMIFRKKHIKGEGQVLYIYDKLSKCIAQFFRNSGELHKV